MKHWFKDQHLRSLFKNSSYLAVSRVVAAIAGIATVSLAAHGLGVLMFGALILITSYAKAVSGLSKFQSWQLIVRYGGRALHGDPDDFKTSTGFAFALDAISGVGGMLVAVAILPLAASWVGITADQLWLAMLYCTLLPTMGAATPSGVLRALDRFDLISWQSTVTPITRAILVAFAYASGAPFEAYVATWYITDLAGDLYLWFLAWRELRRQRPDGGHPSDAAAGIPTRRMAVRHPRQPDRQRPSRMGTDRATDRRRPARRDGRRIVPGRVDPADSAGKPADLLAKAFYPEVIRMDLTSKKPWKLMLRGTALASGMAPSRFDPPARRAGRWFPAVRRRLPRRIRCADDTDARAVHQRVQLPASADALRARPAGRAAEGAARRHRGLFRDRRAAVLELGSTGRPSPSSLAMSQRRSS